MVLVIHTGAFAGNGAGRVITAMVRKVVTVTRPKAKFAFLIGYSFSLISGYGDPPDLETEAVEPSRHLHLSPFLDSYPSTLLFCLRASLA
jgi:hypothetical protein